MVLDMLPDEELGMLAIAAHHCVVSDIVAADAIPARLLDVFHDDSS